MTGFYKLVYGEKKQRHARLLPGDELPAPPVIVLCSWIAEQVIADIDNGAAGHTNLNATISPGTTSSVGMFFSLGDDWQQYSLITVSILTSATTSITATINGMLDFNDPYAMRLTYASSTSTTGFSSASVSSSNPFVVTLLPAGRLVYVSLKNTSATASPDFAVKVVAYH